jgi:hypothetical protein
MAEMIMASLASVGGRESSLRETVRSLLENPFDRVNVYLHGYDQVPDFLMGDSRIFYETDEMGDRGDADKFFWADMELPGYHFTCDDDLVYPPNYLTRMVEKIEQYDRKVVVSAMGHILMRFPMQDYFGDDRRCWPCLGVVPRDSFSHMVGTGVTAYHTETIVPTMQAFPIPNMADIWFGILCRQLGIPVLCVEHDEHWIRHSPEVKLGDTIAGEAIYENKLHCNLLNECHRYFDFEKPLTYEGGQHG